MNVDKCSESTVSPKQTWSLHLVDRCPLYYLRKTTCRKTVVGPPDAASQASGLLDAKTHLYKTEGKVHKNIIGLTCLTALH